MNLFRWHTCLFDECACVPPAHRDDTGGALIDGEFQFAKPRSGRRCDRPSGCIRIDTAAPCNPPVVTYIVVYKERERQAEGRWEDLYCQHSITTTYLGISGELAAQNVSHIGVGQPRGTPGSSQSTTTVPGVDALESRSRQTGELHTDIDSFRLEPQRCAQIPRRIRSSALRRILPQTGKSDMRLTQPCGYASPPASRNTKFIKQRQRVLRINGTHRVAVKETRYGMTDCHWLSTLS